MGQRPRRRQRAWRLFLVAAYALIAGWAWQLAVVELVEHHDAIAEECPDDDGPCDCGPNCHCCLLCAHQIAPALAPAPAPTLLAPVAMVELSMLIEHRAPPSIDHGPPPKVPKHLA
ncbi:MAG: hypothetical protein HOW73_37870 [Polyangiaceae bacterium]|nr:hypothetical protein [Polyangiaceae bacterium]